MMQNHNGNGNGMVDELLTFNEVCRRLMISRSTLYRLITDRELNPVHVGKRRRVPSEQVRSYVERSGERAQA
jgi:excisionase family DNA binding protein